MKCSRNSCCNGNIKIDDIQVENVTTFKYLATIVNIHNKIEEEIKERVAADSRAYFMYEDILASKLLSRR